MAYKFTQTCYRLQIKKLKIRKGGFGREPEISYNFECIIFYGDK